LDSSNSPALSKLIVLLSPRSTSDNSEFESSRKNTPLVDTLVFSRMASLHLRSDHIVALLGARLRTPINHQHPCHSVSKPSTFSSQHTTNQVMATRLLLLARVSDDVRKLGMSICMVALLIQPSTTFQLALQLMLPWLHLEMPSLRSTRPLQDDIDKTWSVRQSSILRQQRSFWQALQR